MDYAGFVASLNRQQREFFLAHESDAELRAQEAFRLGSSLLGVLSALQSDATQHRLSVFQST